MSIITSSDQDYSTTELLFSRTDPRGVILTANDTFCRVSGFTVDELINAPHKIVRHPDMPKGLFWYIWNRLGGGDPVAAYVKNSGKNGGFYWVLAVITPLEDGFLSMRIKPSEKPIALIEEIYAKLCTREQAGELKPEESAAALHDMMQAHGHANYTSFMASQLGQTSLLRAEHTAAETNRNVELLHSVSTRWTAVSEHCDTVLKAYKTFGFTPINMQIQAGHLRDTGIALGVVATNFATIAGQINKDLTSFAEAVKMMQSKIEDASSMSCLQDLLNETQTDFKSRKSASNTDIGVIDRQKLIYEAHADSAVQEVFRQIQVFLTNLNVVGRQLSALSVTRVMCAIENAQISAAEGVSISAIIENLRAFQQEADANMSSIRSHLGVVQQELSRMTKPAQTALSA